MGWWPDVACPMKRIVLYTLLNWWIIPFCFRVSTFYYLSVECDWYICAFFNTLVITVRGKTAFCSLVGQPFCLCLVFGRSPEATAHLESVITWFPTTWSVHSMVRQSPALTERPCHTRWTGTTGIQQEKFNLIRWSANCDKSLCEVN